VNDHDDLDELERELGASLRLALHRAAEPITEARRPPAPSLSPKGPATRGVRFDDVVDDLEVLEPKRAEVRVVDLEPTLGERAEHRRWLVAAAAVVAAALVVGSVLAWAATNNGGPPGPAGPGTTSTTSTTVLRIPIAYEGPVPEGVPSVPEHGDVVAAIAFSHQSSMVPMSTSITVFADGRVLRVGGGIAEQRLSADGVERVRQAFLSVGALDAGQPAGSGVWNSCNCIIRVRDGGRLRSSDAALPSQSPQVDPELAQRVEQLAKFVTQLESSLPPSAWADREIKLFVPSKYRVEVWIEGDENRAVPELSKALRQLLPTPLVERLDAQGWVHTPFGDSVDVTLADARELAEESFASTEISIGLQPLLPDGEPALGAPS
jgi:hypothetical protein